MGSLPRLLFTKAAVGPCCLGTEYMFSRRCPTKLILLTGAWPSAHGGNARYRYFRVAADQSLAEIATLVASYSDRYGDEY